MIKNIFSFYCVVLFSACAISSKPGKDVFKNEKIILENNDRSRLDDSILSYIRYSKQELLQFAKKDSSAISWMVDTEDREHKTYFAVRIGRNFEYRFVTDAWLYIDTGSKEMYEYDLSNDSLIKWTR